VPTHDREGVELTKARKKKLGKEWDAQKKLHEMYLKSIET
jgi:cysteinyl-tRNA synthetase